MTPLPTIAVIGATGTVGIGLMPLLEADPRAGRVVGLDSDDADPAPPPDESQDVYWFSWAEALRTAAPSMTGIITYLTTLR